MTQVLTMMGGVLGTQALALTALALRLRWQAVRDSGSRTHSAQWPNVCLK